jgi:hypothetical protein
VTIEDSVILLLCFQVRCHPIPARPLTHQLVCVRRFCSQLSGIDTTIRPVHPSQIPLHLRHRLHAQSPKFFPLDARRLGEGVVQICQSSCTTSSGTGPSSKLHNLCSESLSDIHDSFRRICLTRLPSWNLKANHLLLRDLKHSPQ